MESATDYRSQCLQLARLLEQKNKEILALQAQLQRPSIMKIPALETMRVFAETLVTVQRKGEVQHKQNGYVDVPKKSFLAAAKTALNGDNIAMYKRTVTALNLVAPTSFGHGGISARINGDVMRVVRVPKDVYDLFVALDGVAP